MEKIISMQMTAVENLEGEMQLITALEAKMFESVKKGTTEIAGKEYVMTVELGPKDFCSIAKAVDLCMRLKADVLFLPTVSSREKIAGKEEENRRGIDADYEPIYTGDIPTCIDKI